VADGEPTTGTTPSEAPAGPPTAETPAAAGGVAVAPPATGAPTGPEGWAGGAVPPGAPPGAPPWGPYPWGPYPWGPPPGGMPYPPTAPPTKRTVTIGRLAAVLSALALLLVGLGVGVGIGAAVWAGSSSPPIARFPGSRSPTGSFRIGAGNGLPSTGPGTGKGFRIGNGSGGPRGGLGGFGGATGTVTKVSGTTVTVKEAGGKTVTVTVPSSTNITVTKPGSSSDLSSGACIRVVGTRTGAAATTPTPNSVNARAVQVLPAADCPSS